MLGSKSRKLTLVRVRIVNVNFSLNISFINKCNQGCPEGCGGGEFPIKTNFEGDSKCIVGRIFETVHL